MPGPLAMARVMAGKDASEEDVARWWYRMELFEHRLWFGPTEPFPDINEWMEQKMAEVPE